MNWARRLVGESESQSVVWATINLFYPVSWALSLVSDPSLVSQAVQEDLLKRIMKTSPALRYAQQGGVVKISRSL